MVYLSYIAVFSCRSRNKVFIGIFVDLKDKFGLNKGQIIRVVRRNECIFCRKKRLGKLFIVVYMLFLCVQPEKNNITIS